MSDYFTEAHGSAPAEAPPIDTGGQAFPNPTSADFKHPQCSGMTLRDWFASQANMSHYGPGGALQARLGRLPNMREMADYVAELRYMEADAMIARRGQP